MAKLRDAPIGKEDIEQYLKSSSDFTFEIAVLRRLVELGFDCKHGGTYEDPVTGKARQFDIRAIKTIEIGHKHLFRLCLSVECKNLRASFPLVVSCLPRRPEESYRELVWSEGSSGAMALVQSPAFPLRLAGSAAVYEARDPVGKSCDQIGRRQGRDGELVGNDGDVFDKISQAINGAYDLVRASHHAGDKALTVISSVVPVLVVPNDRLWAVWYDNKGNVEEQVALASSVSYYVGKRWGVGGPPPLQRQSYTLSHLEIVQLGALNTLVQQHMDPKKFSLRSLMDSRIRQE